MGGGQRLVVAAAVETHPEQAAVLNALLGEEGLPALVLGVKGGVEAHHDAILLVGGQEIPQEGEGHRHARAHAREVAPVESRPEEHDQDEGHVDQGHAQVAREQDQSHDEQGVKAETDEGTGLVDGAPHGLEVLGKGAYEGDLDELRGLDGDPHHGDGEPALACRLHGRARVARHQSQGQDARRKDQQGKPQPIQDHVVVQVGHDEGKDDTQHRHGELHLQLAHAEVVHCAVNRHQTDDREDGGTEEENGIHTAQSVHEDGLDFFGHGTLLSWFCKFGFIVPINPSEMR